MWRRKLGIFWFILKPIEHSKVSVILKSRQLRHLDTVVCDIFEYIYILFDLGEEKKNTRTYSGERDLVDAYPSYRVKPLHSFYPNLKSISDLT